MATIDERPGTSPPYHELRFSGETDGDFRTRVERTVQIAKVLIEACLAHEGVQAIIADPTLPMYTEESVRRHPWLRVEYDEAIAIGGLGETLRMTATKKWGEGPQVLPLEPTDPVDPIHILYVFRPHSRYQRRFEQRMYMKKRLKEHRSLVGKAKYHTKGVFLENLTEEQADAIRYRLKMEPGQFWRVAKGKVFIDVPKPPKQLWLPFVE